MKSLGICVLLVIGCSTPKFKDSAKDVAKGYCEQQCFNNSLTAMEQFDCKRRCGEEQP